MLLAMSDGAMLYPSTRVGAGTRPSRTVGSGESRPATPDRRLPTGESGVAAADEARRRRVEASVVFQCYLTFLYIFFRLISAAICTLMITIIYFGLETFYYKTAYCGFTTLFPIIISGKYSYHYIHVELFALVAWASWFCLTFLVFSRLFAEHKFSRRSLKWFETGLTDFLRVAWIKYNWAGDAIFKPRVWVLTVEHNSSTALAQWNEQVCCIF